MNKYLAFKLNIVSSFILPGYPDNLDSALNDLPTVTITNRNLADKDLKSVHDEGMSLVGEFENVLTCHIENGKRIFVDPNPNADPKFVNTIIGGELMAALLRQRGLLVLHGSCVTNGENTIAFVGDSGWGKSTTAAFFVNNGYSLLSEDLLVLDMKKSTPKVVPGPRGLKLRPDAGNLLLNGFKKLPKVYKATKKRIYSNGAIDAVMLNSIPLGKIFLLEKTNRNTNTISSLSQQAAMIELVKHTRTMSGLSAPSFLKTHFNQCTTLLDHVPISILQRKRELSSLPEIKQLIEEDVAELNQVSV